MLFPAKTGSPSSVCETLGKADIWFIRSFWDMESPRPISPNFKFVGGLHCKPANQLPEAQVPPPAALMTEGKSNTNTHVEMMLPHLPGLGGVHADFRRCRRGRGLLWVHGGQPNDGAG